MICDPCQSRFKICDGDSSRRLYIMYAPGMYKVGVSNDPDRRRGDIQKSLGGEPVSILRVYRARALDQNEVAEKIAHKLLHDYCVWNEWFVTDYATVIRAVEKAIRQALKQLEDYPGCWVCPSCREDIPTTTEPRLYEVYPFVPESPRPMSYWEQGLRFLAMNAPPNPFPSLHLYEGDRHPRREPSHV